MGEMIAEQVNMRKISMIPSHWSRCLVWSFEIKPALTLLGKYVDLQPPVRVQPLVSEADLSPPCYPEPCCCCQGLHCPARLLEFKLLQSPSGYLLSVMQSMYSPNGGQCRSPQNFEEASVGILELGSLRSPSAAPQKRPEDPLDSFGDADWVFPAELCPS